MDDVTNVLMQTKKGGKTSDLFPTTASWDVFIDDKKTTLDTFIDEQKQKDFKYDKAITKLETIETGAEVNTPAFSSVRVNGNRVHATEKRDSLLMEFSKKFTIDVEDKTIRIGIKDTIPASDKQDGLLTKELYRKLMDIEFDANRYIHPNSGVVANVYRRVQVDEKGHVLDGDNSIISIAEGGTGASSLAEAKRNLEIPELEIQRTLNSTSGMPVASDVLYTIIDGLAEKDHGNHVPESDDTASKRFLAEGNTWKQLPTAEEESAGVVKITKDIENTNQNTTMTVQGIKEQLENVRSYINTKISDLIGGADDAFDTLVELQEWIQEHQDLYTALTEITINKVDKEIGKGLSHNDFTDELLQYLTEAHTFIENNRGIVDSEPNVIVKITKNGIELTPDENRTVNIPVPTKVSDLENDSKYLTEHPTVSSEEDTSDSRTLESGDTLNVIDSIVRDKNNHITKINTKSVTLPEKASTHNSFKVNVGEDNVVAFDGSVEKVLKLLAGQNMKIELMEDGIRFTPNYQDADDNVSGLMSALEHKKLAGIAQNANAYALPTAGESLGGVRTTSTVTDVTNYTPTPILNGVPYYRKSCIDVLSVPPTNPPVGYMWIIP